MNSSSTLINALFIFMLAGFIGFEVIRRVSPLLHTPLMSLTNALDAIAVVGAIILAGKHETTLSTMLGSIAIVAATSNMVGGFFITDRMLKMFKTGDAAKAMMTPHLIHQLSSNLRTSSPRCSSSCRSSG